jgi:hypothetical protein
MDAKNGIAPVESGKYSEEYNALLVKEQQRKETSYNISSKIKEISKPTTSTASIYESKTMTVARNEVSGIVKKKHRNVKLHHLS